MCDPIFAYNVGVVRVILHLYRIILISVILHRSIYFFLKFLTVFYKFLLFIRSTICVVRKVNTCDVEISDAEPALVHLRSKNVTHDVFKEDSQLEPPIKFYTIS